MPSQFMAVTTSSIDQAWESLGIHLQNDSADIPKTLRSFFQKLIESTDPIKDPASLIDRVTTLFSPKQLNSFNNLASYLDAQTHLYNDVLHANHTSALENCISSILEACVTFIEVLIATFGIADLLRRPVENQAQAEMKSQKIFMLLSLFTMISQVLFPILGAADGGMIIGGILLFVETLSFLWPLIKPMPTHLPASAENWTKQIQQGSVFAEGRKEALDKIATTFQTKRHALLVGPSRVGKSLTAKAFAQALQRGDYPQLAGKTVFRINVSNLINQQASFMGGGNDILNQIKEAMGRHQEQIILVLDEIHMACKENGQVANQLKTFLDEGGAFPYVIGITTDQDLAQAADAAFFNRFTSIPIQNTNKEETLHILRQLLLRNPSHPLITPDAIESLYEKSCQEENAPQPKSAIDLLNHCLNLIGNLETPSQKKLTETVIKIETLKLEALLNNVLPHPESLGKLQSEYEQLCHQVRNEQEPIHGFLQKKELLQRVKQLLYDPASTSKSLEFRSLALIFSQTVQTHLIELAEKLKKQFQVDLILSKDLIDDKGATE